MIGKIIKKIMKKHSDWNYTEGNAAQTEHFTTSLGEMKEVRHDSDGIYVDKDYYYDSSTGEGYFE